MAPSNSGLTPSIAPPAGHQPNFADPQYDRNGVYIPLSICTGVAIIFFFVCTFTKHYIMKDIHVEDCKSSVDNVLNPWLIGMPICSFLVGYNNTSSESRICSDACCQNLNLVSKLLSSYGSNVVSPAINGILLRQQCPASTS